MKKLSTFTRIMVWCGGVLLVPVLQAGTMSQSPGLNTPKSSKIKDILTYGSPEILYNYTDFNFNSLSGRNVLRYHGHANFYGIGENFLKLSPKLFAGIYFFKTDIKTYAQNLLNPRPLKNFNQSVHNNMLYGHIISPLHPRFFLDIGAGYAQSQFSTDLKFNTGNISPVYGFARTNGHNWLAKVTGIYHRSWEKTVFRADVGFLLSQSTSDYYRYQFAQNILSSPVQSLLNHSDWTYENIEMGYAVTPHIMPILTAGLVQVVHSSNNHPLVSGTINGSLPQLSMDQGGFRVGGGVTLGYRNWNLRIEEKYYNSRNVYTNYQTLFILKLKMS